MCNCKKSCSPSFCQCNYKKSCVKDLSTDDVVYDSTVEIPCFGIQPGTPLTEALQTIGTAVCDIRDELTSASAVIINTGDGEEIYSGDTPAGAKQLKTLEGSDSVILTSDANEITISVDEDWLDARITAETDQTIVFFNTANPNSGSPVFTPNQPQDSDVVYTSSVNNSLWIWNGTLYATYIPPQTTPFNLAGTSTDAGGNKTTAITRTGNIGINIATPLQALHVVGTIRQSAVTSAITKTNASGDIIAAVAGTDYLTPTGSAAGLTSFPTLNQNTTGTAATVITNANLTGDVTSVGNATTLSASGVTAGTYTTPTISVDAKGRITSAASGGAGGVIEDLYTDESNVGATESGLYEILVPGGTVAADGDKLTAFFAGTLSNAGNAKTVSFKFNTSSFGFNTSTNGSFVLRATLIRTSSSTMRVALESQLSTASSAYVGEYTAIDFTDTISLKLNATGTVSGDVTAKFGTASFVPKAP